MSQQALAMRVAEADDASAVFDFESEGSLATFWRQATPGTTYWRGYVPMKALPGSVAGIGPDSLELVSDDPLEIRCPQQHGDTAIWQFLGDDARSRIVFQLQRQGLRTLMEVDDNYLRAAPQLFGIQKSWHRTHEEAVQSGTGYSVEMHRKQVPMMDGIICATDHLANEYEAYNPNVYVCPNSIDPDDWDVPRVESETLRIGYYGGASHQKDWPLAKKAMKWASRQPGVEIVTVGFKPPGYTGRYYGWQDDLFKARLPLGTIDVGIAPLARNNWADGKSDLKGLEYAMAGVMPILQDAPPYAPWRDMGWEWMPRTEADWVDAIHDVVAMRDEVKALAAEAKAYVLRERTIEKNIDSWRAAIRG